MNDTDKAPEPAANLNEIKRRYPPDIAPEDFMKIIEADREDRAGWVRKQADKGKEE